MGIVPSLDQASDDVYLMFGTFKANESGGVHALIRSARAGEPDAVHRVLDVAKADAHRLLPGLDSAVLAIVPSHLPGRAQGLLMAVADVLAAERDWQLSARGLVRIAAAAEAKLGGPRNAIVELATIAWHQPSPGAGAIVVLDDICRSGASIAACRHAIVRAGDSRPTYALALARAIAVP